MKTLLTLFCMFVVAHQALGLVNVKDLKPIRRTVDVLTQKPFEGRIIGGDFATLGQFPYQVALDIDNAYFCGGSLISDDIVLTAAHCVDGFSNWTITAGALNISDETEPGRVSTYTEEFKVHEEWQPILINNDIALLFLRENITGPNIGTVSLPSWSMENFTFVNETARVSGWGKPSDASSGISEVMKYVDVVVITNDECITWYGAAINPSNICTGTNDGTEATCNGDSGGPLTNTLATGDEPIQIGIVSFGSSLGCETRFPSAFTRVTSYLRWIEQNSGVIISP